MLVFPLKIVWGGQFIRISIYFFGIVRKKTGLNSYILLKLLFLSVLYYRYDLAIIAEHEFKVEHSLLVMPGVKKDQVQLTYDRCIF